MGKKRKKFNLEKFSMGLTYWIGSPASILIHTVIFIAVFGLHFFGVNFDQIMLIVTTAVSLEAIYLALFIQMTVNRHTQSLEDVEEDLDEIASDVDSVVASVDELEDEVDEISADIDDIQAEDEIEEAEDADINKNLITLSTQIKNLQKEIVELKRISREKK